jgi:iron(III) transport system ATP-binding protein
VARLTIQGLTKRFGSYTALNNLSLDVRDGEFIAILGPSGCGKTTLLRIVAGFDRAEEGEIMIGERIVSSPSVYIPPELRQIGIVFQSYALWPHMTVAENVGYSLKIAGVARAERDKRVRDALALVGLEDFAERPPAMLSGGQRQRVALARCLVASPSLVLLDEPLANLDVHLRASMENEFHDFHMRSGTTMFYITHDQAEAMALADRIAVMDHGRLMQLATPSELFREPANEMVASFIGNGLIVPAEICDVQNGIAKARIAGIDVSVRCRADQMINTAGRLCLRPRDLAIVAPSPDVVCGRVIRAIYQGGYFRLEIKLDALPGITLVVQQPETLPVNLGDAVGIRIDDGWVIPFAG